MNSSFSTVSFFHGVSASSSLIFLVLLPLRFKKLRPLELKIRPGPVLVLKISLSLLSALCSVSYLGLWIFLDDHDLNDSLFPVLDWVTGSIAALGVGILTFQEHQRSLQPSDLIVLYLIASSACDGIWLVLSSWIGQHRPVAILLLPKLLLICLESRGKESLLLERYQGIPAEERAGILSRTFFWWIHDILEEGYQGILVNQELPVIDRKLSSGTLRQNVVEEWKQRGKSESKATLPKVLLHCLSGPFLSCILPRLFLSLFRFGQPLLISQSIRLIQGSSWKGTSEAWIVLAAAVVYLGLAISTALYHHRLNKLRVMIRGSLIGLLHHKALIAQSGTCEDGKAIALMTSDVASVETASEMFHEMWGLVIELIVGVVLLATQVGWLWPLPFAIIFSASRVSRYVAMSLKDRQGAWNRSTQERIAATGAILGGIKNSKMLGMQGEVQDYILNLRHQELKMAERVRWMMAIYNASANAVGMFVPVVTIVVYAVLATARGSALDTETAFTSVAILALVTHPANMIMTIVPRAVASFSSFERIQNYLQESTVQDQRTSSWSGGPDTAAANSRSPPAISLHNLAISNQQTSHNVLQHITLDIPQGSLVICSGAVGSGKSSLCRVVLGEIAPASGTVSVISRKISFCDQIPWLPSKSIKDCVYGLDLQSSRDIGRYQSAIATCCLDEDLRELPSHDGTLVGNMGLNLSGGQRQRVALARAVYAQNDLVILDDSFNALDGKTESRVIENLLGREGVFRKRECTVLWITNSAKYFPLADKIIVLGDFTIQEQGTWDSLREKSAQVAKVIHPESAEGEAPASGLNSSLQARSQVQYPRDIATDISRKTGDLSLYSYYFRAAGGGNVIFLILCTALCAAFSTFSQYWLKWWTDSGSSHTTFYIVGYVLLFLAAWVSTNGIKWFEVMKVAPRSGVVLHRRLLKAVIGAPLIYYSETDLGVILNRFSQDIQLVDKELATAGSSLSAQVFKVIAQAVILFLVQPYMTLTLPFCVVVVYIVQKVYLRTSRQLRLLELESRSAVHSSFFETIQGIRTIRAFGWQKAAAEVNIRSLNNSQVPFYLLLCLQRWLNIILNLLIAVIAIGIIWLAVAWRRTTAGAEIGVALNVILLTNTTLLKLVESWTDVEISLGAVARLREADRDTPREDRSPEKEEPGEAWPASGGVEFVNMTAAYNSEAIALRNITLTIAPGQTVVICGRTGSGKSSLLLSLLRLLEIQVGRIEVDGVDLRRLPRALIRQRCFITIPQEAFLFPSASIRFNLDPSGRLPDKALVSALEMTGLWAIFRGAVSDGAVNESPEPADHGDVFDKLLTSFPELSVGQTQLFALARALLHARVASDVRGTEFADYPVSQQPKPIVLMDEATSSLDPETESRMYDIIQEHFIDTGHTVVMVTHKLGTFADRMRQGKDKIVWMRDGLIEGISNAENLLGFSQSAS